MNDDPSPVAEADSDADRHEQDGAANGAGAIGRRRYLHVAGGALGALATGAVGVGHAQEVTIRADTDRNIDAKDASDRITLSPGESIQVHVGENQYGYYGDLENVLIDITAEGADAIVTSHGGEWVIRNVGIRGESNGDLSYRPLISAKTKDSTHMGLIEHVYLGDGGNHGGHGSGRAGIHVAYGHRGTITVRDLNVANWTDNGVYGSSPGKDGGGGGVVEIENSYGKNNNIANFRIGTPGSSVRDSISVAEGTQTDLNICRGVWCRHRDSMVVENTDIDLSGPAATPAVVASKGGSVTYRDSEYSTTYEYGDFSGDVSTSDLGSDPSSSRPSGVPESAEAAVGGTDGSEDGTSDGGSDGSAEERDGEDTTDDGDSTEDTESDSGSSTSGEHSLVIEGTGSTTNGPREYQVTVDGTIADKEGSAEDVVSDSGTELTGKVWAPFTDRYTFDGEITAFEAEGSVAVEVDGEAIDPDSLGSDGSTEDDDSDSDSGSSTGGDRSLVVRGTGSTTNGAREYHIAVEGGTIADEEDSTDDVVSNSGTEVSGKIWAPFTDRYAFSGSIVSFEAEGSVAAEVDGEAIDPDSL